MNASPRKRIAALAQPEKFGRTPVARGSRGVDRKAGYGVIRRFSVITRGEARGHGAWIDAAFAQSVADAINATPGGVKARFTHPGMSGDGLGKYLGRVRGASLEGDSVVADLFFAKSAHDTPDGNLAAYVMQLAEDDPAAFGASIAFMRDEMAEKEFAKANKKSPDAANAANLPHVRMKELRAVDAVDSPAANPRGLFHGGRTDIAAEAEQVLSYALGLTAEAPEVTAFDIDADRAQGFVQSFLDRHGLAIVAKAPEVPSKENEMSQDEKPAEKPAEVLAESKPAEVVAPAVVLAEIKPAEGPRFLAAFGPQGGVWYAEGKSFDESQALYLAKLSADNAALAAKLAEAEAQLKAARGEQKPLSASDAETLSAGSAGGKGEPDAVARFAAGIKLPGSK